MDPYRGAWAGIVTVMAMMMVFLLTAGSAAMLPNPAGPLRAGMWCLVFIHLAYTILESKFVPPPLEPGVLDPAQPHLLGRNDNDDDGYRAPPQSPVSAYSSTESPVGTPARASPAETASYLESSSSSSSESEGVAGSSRSASTTRASSSSSDGSSSSSRSRRDLVSDSDHASSDFDWKDIFQRRLSPSGSISSGSAETASREAKRPRSRSRRRGGNKTKAYIKLRRMLCLRRSASGRSRSPSLRSRRRRHVPDTDLSDADKVGSWMNGHHRRSPSTGSRSSSGRRSRSSASASRRSRGRRGGKKSAFNKLKTFFNRKR